MNNRHKQFVIEYCNNGYNATQAYLAVYKCKKTTAETNGRLLLQNTAVIKAIEIKTAETEQRLDLSREAQHKKLQKAIALAYTTNSPAAAISGIREQNQMLGYHRESAPNFEREKSLAQRLSQEDRKLAELAARIRTSAESRPKLKLRKVGG